MNYSWPTAQDDYEKDGLDYRKHLMDIYLCCFLMNKRKMKILKLIYSNENKHFEIYLRYTY